MFGTRPRKHTRPRVPARVWLAPPRRIRRRGHPGHSGRHPRARRRSRCSRRDGTEHRRAKPATGDGRDRLCPKIADFNPNNPAPSISSLSSTTLAAWAEEISEVETQINRNFANIIEDAGIDYRVVVISQYGFNLESLRSSEPSLERSELFTWTQGTNNVCVAAPLGGGVDDNNDGLCDSFPEAPRKAARFRHLSYRVSSGNGACMLLSAIDGGSTIVYTGTSTGAGENDGTLADDKDRTRTGWPSEQGSTPRGTTIVRCPKNRRLQDYCFRHRRYDRLSNRRLILRRLGRLARGLQHLQIFQNYGKVACKSWHPSILAMHLKTELIPFGASLAKPHSLPRQVSPPDAQPRRRLAL